MFGQNVYCPRKACIVLEHTKHVSKSQTVNVCLWTLKAPIEQKPIEQKPIQLSFLAFGEIFYHIFN